MKSLKFIIPILLLAVAASAHGKLAGKNVILVHGLQTDDLGNPPSSQQEVAQNGADYWRAFWLARSDARVDFASNERLEGGIAQRVFNQLADISRRGLCDQGCVLVTHSTGDLVARYFLDNQARWLSNAGLQPLDIVASLDFAGAGGGSELADLAVNAANGGVLGSLGEFALDAFLGSSNPERLGVINDLQPSVARNIATSPNDIPRLRFVGGGSADSLNWARAPLLPGKDDGTVALHSACGATQVDSYDSCVSNLALNGKLTGVKAPGSLYFNHFPVLLGADTNHSAVINNETGNTLTVAENNIGFDGLDFGFETETFTRTRFWFFKDTFRVIPNSEQFSMSGLVVDTVN